MDTIAIAPMSRRNSITLMCCGGLLLALAILLNPFWPGPSVGLGVTSLALLFLGFIKRQDKVVSVHLTPEGLHYHHRKGEWFLPWGEIQRLDQPRLPDTHEPLDFVGLRLIPEHTHLEHIRPRLALALLMEQRPLHQLTASCDEGACMPSLSSKKHPHLTGVMAAYAAQMNQLRDGLGFDLYLPHSVLDRSSEQMVSLIKQYRQQALHQGD